MWQAKLSRNHPNYIKIFFFRQCQQPEAPFHPALRARRKVPAEDSEARLLVSRNLKIQTRLQEQQYLQSGDRLTASSLAPAAGQVQLQNRGMLAGLRF